MTNRLRVGVLGAGAWARAAHVPGWQRDPRSEIAVICDVIRDRAEALARQFGIREAADDWQAVVSRTDLDIIDVATPSATHFELSMAALEAGKHVLCEKPFTANAEEARAVAKVAADAGLVCMEAFHWRYHPLALGLLDLLGRGELGTLRHVEASMCAPVLASADIRWQLSLAGGSLMDMGCYPVSFVRVMTGEEPEVVRARALERSPGVDRYLEADLTFPSGITATIRCGMLSGRVLDVRGRLLGDRGEVRVLNPFAPHYASRVRVRTDAGRRVERPTRVPTYDFQLRAFRDAVVDGVPPLTGTDFAIANMDAIDAIYAAAGLPRREPTPVAEP